MKRALLFASIALALASCDRPQKTVDQLRDEISAYKASPSEAAQEKIEADFTKLSTQIGKLRADGKTAEASGYQSSAENLRADYRTAQMVNAMKDAQSAIKDIGTAFKEAGKSIGDAFRDASTPTPTPPSP